MAEDIQTLQWYVLKAIGGKERKVQDYLLAEIKSLKLQDKIGQVLIPSEKYYAVRSGKKIVKERIIYPGYVLVQCIFDGEIPFILRNIPGVLGFLHDEKTNNQLLATPLREAEVNRLLGQYDEMADAPESDEIEYLEGESVKVVDGPFASFVGTIDKIDKANKKLTVSVKIFGRKTPLELSYTQVEKH